MLKEAFSRFLGSRPGRLHAAAHSHHPWPDASYEAHMQAWHDAADLHDGKWDHVLDEVLPRSHRHIARVHHLPDAASVATAGNTHELLVRVLSCLPTPTRILTTDAEFHSADRQTRRLAEDELVAVERVAAEPFETFSDRFAAAAGRGGHHMVLLSHVFFDSGFVADDLEAIVAAVPDAGTFVVVDGYHASMALPVDLSRLADRVFYLAGGYKYAMAGEGACWMHCPPGYGSRPRNTGWFAGFADLQARPGGPVTYPADGRRFLGSTFDPTPWYRFNAVQALLAELGVTPADVHAHVRRLQERFVALAEEAGLSADDLVVPASAADRGNFLAYRVADAAELDRRLAARGVVVDHRGDVVRFGFGVYHDEADVDELVDRLAAALA